MIRTLLLAAGVWFGGSIVLGFVLGGMLSAFRSPRKAAQ
jgi:hypothetical protein